MGNALRKEQPDYYLNLSGAQVPRTVLTDTNLVSANFSQANMEGSDFSRAAARDADFSRANLRGTKFIDVDLRNASLACADLTGADLTGARLDGANMTGAILSSTRLAKVDISQVKGLDGYQISLANIDRDSVNASVEQIEEFKKYLDLWFQTEQNARRIQAEQDARLTR